MRTNLIAVAFVSLMLAAPAAIAQLSKSTVSSQISSQFPDQNTGQITPATTRTFLNNMLNSYQQFAGLNKQVGTTYTILTSDYGQLVTFNHSGTVAVALSPANSTGFSTFNFYAQNITTSNVVITPSGGSTICGASALTLANTQTAWVISDGTNYQCMFGIAGTQLANPLAVANGGTGGSVGSGTLLDNITGFSLTGFILRSAAGSYSFLSQTNGLTLGNLATVAGTTTICNPTSINTQLVACTAGQMSAVLCVPTRQNFITATNTTYTTPTCNGVLPTYLEIEMVGGGGGGAGSGTTPGAATAGTNSCWNTSGTACSSPTFSANGGGLGSVTSGTPAAGGTTTTCDLGIPGGQGQAPNSGATTTQGGQGGTSYFGGNGPSGSTGAGSNAGLAAATNSGSGGGGAGTQGTANTGGGGGAGGYCRKIILVPVASYVTTVGTHGNGGTLGGSGAAGGNGADGNVVVTAHWQ